MHCFSLRYRNSLETASSHGITHVAFPALSCGEYGYPLDDAADVALEAVLAFGQQQSDKSDVVQGSGDGKARVGNGGQLIPAVVKVVTFVMFGKTFADTWVAAAERMNMHHPSVVINDFCPSVEKLSRAESGGTVDNIKASDIEAVVNIPYPIPPLPPNISQEASNPHMAMDHTSRLNKLRDCLQEINLVKKNLLSGVEVSESQMLKLDIEDDVRREIQEIESLTNTLRW